LIGYNFNTKYNNIENKTDYNKREDKKEVTRTNESSGVYVRGFVKITDPETGKIIVQTAN